MWGTMNRLVSLSASTSAEEDAQWMSDIFNRTDRIAFYELELLLGNANFTSVYTQSASEVAAVCLSVSAKLKLELHRRAVRVCTRLL